MTRREVSLAAIVLAGGESSRMGRPKALAQYRGETFLDRLIGLYNAAGVQPVVVLGHGAETIRRGLQRIEEAIWVVNPEPSRGQLSSLQEGLRALPEGYGGFFIHPVDTPAVEAETVSRLQEEFRRTPRMLLFVPCFEGKRGHPVLARADLGEEFLALGEGATARDVIHGRVGETMYLDAGDPGILKDIDTPDDYERLMREECN